MGRKLWKWYVGRWGKLIAILAGVYFVISFLGDVTAWTPLELITNPIARFVAAGLLVAYFGLNWWEANNRYIDVFETRPNVIATGFDKEIVPTTLRSITANASQVEPYSWLQHIRVDDDINQYTTDSYINVIENLSKSNVSSRARKGDTFERFYIIFRNMKPNENDIENAENVHARLVFYDVECNPQKFHEKPRWRNKPTPDKPQQEVVISASGKPEQLCLFIRKKGQKKAYIFSDDSYTQDAFEPLKKELELQNESYFVHIILSGKNLNEKNFWVAIENITSENPTFNILKSSPCK